MGFKKLIPLFAAVLVAGAGLFYVGYYVGTQTPHHIVVEGVTNLEDGENADFGVYWQAWDVLRGQHVRGDEPANLDFIYNSIQGMVRALNDPNTIFLPPEDARKFEEDVTGRFGGIGAEIGMRNNQVVIVAPLKGSPAERANLRPGDMVLQVDGESTDGLTVNDAVKLIRGDVGVDVALLIYREGWSQPRTVTITRELITVPTLSQEYIAQTDEPGDEGAEAPKDIAHIQLFSFNENAPRVFYESIMSALEDGAKGLILDLRNNPGGFLEVAVNLAGWFVDRGDVVVTQRFKSGDERVFRASGNAALQNFPTVVLVNGGSASASEILAGALRDHLTIPLVGTKTFGKGSVQELFRLKDDSTLKITVAEWVLPSGQVIEGEGIQPDIEIELTEDDFQKGNDPQLKKATEVLRGIIQKRADTASGSRLNIIQL